MIAQAASENPDSEPELLAAAELGLVPLRDACIAARARVEDPVARRKRHHRSRELRMWTDTDGMLAGRFRLTPEIGAQVKAKLDADVQRIFRARKSGEHEPQDAYAADALADFVLNDNDPDARGDPNATIDILIDHDASPAGSRPTAKCARSTASARSTSPGSGNSSGLRSSPRSSTAGKTS